jgi:hypothetical protein
MLLSCQDPELGHKLTLDLMNDAREAYPKLSLKKYSPTAAR